MRGTEGRERRRERKKYYGFNFLKKWLCAMKEFFVPPPSLSSLYQGNSPGEQYKAVICVTWDLIFNPSTPEWKMVRMGGLWGFLYSQ